MNQYIKPSQAEWEAISKRPTLSLEDLDEGVQKIIDRVKSDGDRALKEFTLQFDQVSLENIKVNSSEIELAKSQISDELKLAISTAAENIRKFHTSQQVVETPVETMEGITCWRKNVAIENVGLYIPGGSAPLFSTILMLGIPALIAGCKRIVLCTPCDKNGVSIQQCYIPHPFWELMKFIKSAEPKLLLHWLTEHKVFRRWIKFSDQEISM